MNILLMLIIIVVCLVVEGFFSGSEMGIVSADQMKLRHEAAKGSRGARLALKLLKKPEWLLSTTLVGTNIAVVTNTTVTKVVGDQRQSPFTLREEIVTMMDMPAEEGDIQLVEQTMIRRMFDFSETTVYEVMVPLIDVVAIERSKRCGEAMARAAQKAHVRLPVYEERVDRVVGVLNTLELLGMDPAEPIEPHIRPVRYVPRSKSINDLLLELREDGDAVAVVVDEFGGADGIVTVEDIVEEVVEELEDEYDVRKKTHYWIRKLGERDYLVSARIELDVLEEALGLHLSEGTYATLAGFLLEKARDVPAAGTIIEAYNIVFTIRRATPQALQEVRLRW